VCNGKQTTTIGPTNVTDCGGRRRVKKIKKTGQKENIWVGRATKIRVRFADSRAYNNKNKYYAAPSAFAVQYGTQVSMYNITRSPKTVVPVGGAGGEVRALK